jgi:quercetin dioxygenase-like cupin family protein
VKTEMLMNNWEFQEKNPYAQPLFVAHDGRILRFALRPGQVVEEHQAPHSPVYIVVLKGQGIFSNAEGIEQKLGPNTLIIFEAGEKHSIRALDADLVFIAFLHGTPGTH